ncbi:MAG TPA: zinc ribbon domain-containing protein [Kofleriaceae bacterium]|jgi:hypothetical protein
MNAVCPACGVAVVPGYVRCPRCHAALPLGARSKRTTADPGGTAVARGGFPISAVLVGLGVAAIVLVVGLGLRARGGSKQAAAPEVMPAPVEVVSERPVPRVASAPLIQPAPAPAPAPTTAQDRRAAALGLEDLLRRQRLWGRTEIIGDRIDVRSGSCADPAMRPAIDGERTALRGAGLTRLRCLEQSGAVVFERDL